MKDCSVRLQERAKSLKFREPLSEMSAFLDTQHPDTFYHKILNKNQEEIHIFGLIDKNSVPAEIQALKFATDCKGPLLAYLDVTIDFLHGKTEMNIDSFNFREVESFLRDRNDVPSSPGEGTTYYPIIDQLKTELSKRMSSGEEKVQGEKKSPTIKDDYDLKAVKEFPNNEFQSFDDVPHDEKSFYVNKVITEKISPLLRRDGGDVRCVFNDDTLCVLEYVGACAGCLYSLSTTMNFIQKVLRLELACPNLLVMTDS